MPSETEKLLLGLAAVGGAIGLGYVVVTRLVPGASSSACTTPGSACYSALQPLLNSYQICANQYASNLATYLEEDNANGTGLTATQQNNLSYLTNCMNYWAAQVATTAKNYNVDPLATVQTWGTQIIEAAFVAAGIGLAVKYLPNIVTVIRSGATTANAMLNSIIRYGADNAIVTTESASALQLSLPTVSDAIQTYDQNILDALATEDIITAEEATTVINDDITNILVDFATTNDILGALIP